MKQIEWHIHLEGSLLILLVRLRLDLLSELDDRLKVGIGLLLLLQNAIGRLITE
jgi:hypothetical protein